MDAEVRHQDAAMTAISLTDLNSCKSTRLVLGLAAQLVPGFLNALQGWEGL